MSRLTGGNASWPQPDPYLMRFNTIAPHWPFPPPASGPVRPGGGSAANDAAAAVAAVSHHHAATGWPSAPGPFGILPHQETASVPTAASAAPYGFASGTGKSSLHHRHHTATDQYLAAAMNAAAHDQNYRYVNHHIMANMNMSMTSSRTPASVRSGHHPQHQTLHQTHHSSQYPAVNSFSGSERLARDFMSASSSAVYSQHQSPHHPQNGPVIGMDPNQMLMQQHWYSAVPVPRMTPVMSQRMQPASVSGQSGSQRRSSDVSSSCGSAGSNFAAAWGSYANQAHCQSMHQQNHQLTAKYPSAGSCSSGSSYHQQQGSGRSHAAAGSSNNSNQQLGQSSHSFNSYLSSCGMQMMNGLGSSQHLLPSSSGIGHSPPQMSGHLPAVYAATSTASTVPMSRSPAHVSGSAQNSSNNNMNSGSNSGSSGGNGSRPSSVTPSRLPVAQGTDSCSYSAYNSPSGNSVHNSYSPYPASGRNSSSANNSSNTGSSHTPTPVPHGPSPVVNQTPLSSENVSSYESGASNSLYASGPNGASGQTYQPVMTNAATAQRLTPPSSGYPTPPASVSQAATNNVVGDDSSHGIHSHFPLTPQSGSSYYSSSSGYSSNSKCSTDSSVSAGSSAGSGSSGSSCMVAAAAMAAGYSSLMTNLMPNLSSMTSEIAEATQPPASCLAGIGVDGQHAKNTDPAIPGTQTDHNLESVFTEQEIEFPSITYNNNETDYSATKSKKRKDGKSKKDKKKKEKAKQVAAADRIALSSFPPFDAPVPHFGQHELSHFPGQMPMQPTAAINPYLMPNPHQIDETDLMTQMSSNAPLYTSGSGNDLMNGMAPSSVFPSSGHLVPSITTDISVNQQQQQCAVSQNASLHPHAIENVQPQDQRMQEKDTFADLEDDLRMLTEGTPSSVCATQTQVSSLSAPSVSSMEPELPNTNLPVHVSYEMQSAPNESPAGIQQTSQMNYPKPASESPDSVAADSIVSNNSMAGANVTETERKTETDDLLDFIHKNSEHENHDPATFEAGDSHISRSNGDHEPDELSASKKKKKKLKDKTDKSKSKCKSTGLNDSPPKTEVDSYESQHIPFNPQGKSCKTNESNHDKKQAVQAAGDSKFFKNRPQNVILATESRCDSESSGSVSENVVPKSNNKSRGDNKATNSNSKKRKSKEEMRNGCRSLPLDEYEFRESPSEPSRKKAKKTVSTSPATVSRTAKKGTSTLESKGLPVNSSPVPVPVPSTNSKGQTAKSAKSTTGKKESVVKKEPSQTPSSKSEADVPHPPPIKCDISDRTVKSDRSSANAVPSSKSSSSANKSSPSSKSSSVNQTNCNNKSHSDQQIGKEAKTVPSSAKGQSVKQCDKQQPVVSSVTKQSPPVVNGSNKKDGTNTAGQMGTNTPRRRSQDKKALTIKEGLMRTGDFVVSIDEMSQTLPMIWRIEGKSLLQRFEPSKQDGITVYTNTSSVSYLTSLSLTTY